VALVSPGPLAVLGLGLLAGAGLGWLSGLLLDVLGRRLGRHRTSGRRRVFVRSMLPLALPWLVLIAACLPIGGYR
jgi:hypothetical protein